MFNEKQTIDLLKRIGWEGTKAVLFSAAMLGLTSIFDGSIKNLTIDDYIRGKKEKK